MNEFTESNWNVENFSLEYLKKADLRMPQRLKLYECALSFYNFFYSTESDKLKIVDLGCGDGFLVELLAKLNPNVEFLLVDGSEKMINAAKERLKNLKNVNYKVITLEEAIDFNFSEQDFFISSLAIHHMTTGGKVRLFKNIYNNLKEGGYFLNLDVVSLSKDEKEIEDWYLKVWEEEISRNQQALNVDGDFTDFIQGHQREEHYKNLDPLETQLTSLKSAGFKAVNCHYKNATFVVYGGKK